MHSRIPNAILCPILGSVLAQAVGGRLWVPAKRLIWLTPPTSDARHTTFFSRASSFPFVSH